VADVLKLVIAADAKGAKKEIGETSTAHDGMNKAADKVAKAGLAAIAIGGAAATAAIVGVTKATIGLSEDLNQLTKRARAIGFPVDEMDLAEGVIGLLTDGTVDATRAMQDFQRSLAEARDGTAAQVDAMDKLGLSVEDFDGLGLVEQMSLVSDNFGNLKDDAEATQVAMDLFGRSGRQIVAALRQGGDAISVAAGQIRESGLITEEMTAKAEILQDSLLLLQRSADALRRDALVPLMPVIAGTADFIADLANDFRGTGEDAETLGDIVHTVFMEQILPAIFTTATQGSKALKGLSTTFRFLILSGEATRLMLKEVETGFLLLGEALGLVDESDVAESLQGTIEALRATTEAQAALDAATRGFASADEEALAAFDALLASIQTATTASIPAFSSATNDAAGAVDNLADSSEAASKAAADRQTEIDRLAQSIKFLGLTAEEAAQVRFEDSLQALGEAFDEGLLSFDAYVARIQVLRAELEALGQTSEETAEKTTSSADRYDESLRGVASSLSSVSFLAGEVGNAVSEMHGENTKEARQASRAIFAIQQGLALAVATVNLFQAIAQANASGPYPQNIPAIVAASITGGAQIAGIAATTIAGVADAGLTEDQVRRATSGSHSAFIVQSGESIIDRSGTREISRMMQLQRMQMERDAQGGSSGGGSSVIVMDGRVVSEVIGDRFVRDQERGTFYADRRRV